jgi:serine phosphatase RsbU (regulator of sigma subunit)
MKKALIILTSFIALVLPFTGCQNVVNKTSTVEAESMIQAASEAKDFERLEHLADSLGMAGKLSKGEEIESILDRPLFIYTDGLNEAENSAKEQYGDDRMLNFLRNSGFESARQVISTITEDVEKHRNGAEPNDDLTMMCIYIKSTTKQE